MSTVRPRIQRWITVGLAIAIGGAATSAVALSNSQTQPMTASPLLVAEDSTTLPVEDNVLVVIRREGGFCMPPGCFSEVTIFTNGTYRYSTHDSEPITGRIREAKLQWLQRKIRRTEVGDLYAAPRVVQPIDDFCGLAFDGPEVIYVLQREDGAEEVRGCDFAIDPEHRLVRRLERIYSRILRRAASQPEIETE